MKLSIDRGEITILVLFDFSKAFDMVDHNILLRKMHDLGFSNSVLEWVFAYLSGRKLAVKDSSGNISSWSDVVRGVPQGSGLGPSFFSILINDIATCLKFMKRILYADDLQAYLSCLPKELIRALLRVESDIHAVADWANTNLLRLNLEKTKILIVGSKRTIASIDLDQLVQINIDNTVIPFVKSARNLGLTFTTELNWSNQIRDISKRIYFCLRSFNVSRKSLSVETKLQLVSAIIVPYIGYCCLIFLDNTIAQDSILKRALNSCLRFIFGLRRRTRITPYYERLQWLKVEKRRFYFLGTFMYQMMSSRTPAYLFEKLQPPVIVHQYLLRQTRALQVPFTRRRISKNPSHI